MQKVVLLIDDNKEELSALTNALQLAGIDSLGKWVNSADEAFYYLKQVVPDYIFFDLGMSQLNGLSCLQQIRKMKKLDQVPVIFYSSALTEESCEEAVHAGVSCCIQKTTSTEELVKNLDAIFASC